MARKALKNNDGDKKQTQGDPEPALGGEHQENDNREYEENPAGDDMDEVDSQKGMGAANILPSAASAAESQVPHEFTVKSNGIVVATASELAPLINQTAPIFENVYDLSRHLAGTLDKKETAFHRSNLEGTEFVRVANLADNFLVGKEGLPVQFTLMGLAIEPVKQDLKRTEGLTKPGAAITKTNLLVSNEMMHLQKIKYADAIQGQFEKIHSIAKDSECFKDGKRSSPQKSLSSVSKNSSNVASLNVEFSNSVFLPDWKVKALPNEEEEIVKAIHQRLLDEDEENVALHRNCEEKAANGKKFFLNVPKVTIYPKLDGDKNVDQLQNVVLRPTHISGGQILLVSFRIRAYCTGNGVIRLVLEPTLIKIRAIAGSTLVMQYRSRDSDSEDSGEENSNSLSAATIKAHEELEDL